jgi:hypothetical protein
MSDDIKMLHMYENGLPEWVIAESRQECVELYKEYATTVEGLGLDDIEFDLDPDNWDELPANQDFTFHEDLADQSHGKTKTVAEWCAEHGKGWFATSEY